MTFQDWVILAGVLLPIVGNLVAFILRKANQPGAAALVDRVIPLSAQLGMAKSAKDLIELAHDAAHVITTTEPNSIKLTNEDETVSVRMDLAQPSKAPPSTVTLNGEDTSTLQRVGLALVFALVAFGCGAAQQVEHVVQVSSQIIERAEPCLMVQYEAAQRQCLELPTDAERRGCVADARAVWKPVIDSLGELRTVRCGLEPQKCAAQEDSQ